MSKPRHVIKHTHKDGIKLQFPELWCGTITGSLNWLFQSAQHVALSAGGSIQPCKKCIRAIIQELEQELDNE